jgi:hypothetical protein
MEYFRRRDDELLLGGAILSELCSLVVREVDIAAVHGAYLASILAAVSNSVQIQPSRSPAGELSACK